jgi:hypothetical protein
VTTGKKHALEDAMNPQGQRPEDVGEDLPDPASKPPESDKDRGKKNTGKQADGKKATRDHRPGKM